MGKSADARIHQLVEVHEPQKDTSVSSHHDLGNAAGLQHFQSVNGTGLDIETTGLLLHDLLGGQAGPRGRVAVQRPAHIAIGNDAFELPCPFSFLDHCCSPDPS